MRMNQMSGYYNKERDLHCIRLLPSGIYGAVYGLTLFLASCMRSFWLPFLYKFFTVRDL